VKRCAVALALGALLLPGAAASSPRLTVFAASSLATVFPRVDRAPRYDFDGSDRLYAQLDAGAPADVFAAASPKYAQLAFEKGLVLKPVVFATNSLVLIVPAANPAHIRKPADLRRKGIKLVIGAAGVPIGDYTRKVLARMGLGAALKNVVSEERDARSILAKVSLGEADAGFVYVTDARVAGSRVHSLTLPAQAQPTVKYEIAVVKASANRAAAQAFVRRVLGAAGQGQLRRAGFGAP
jgi:molybdate transport system substrate-binding protein